jgi:hypothetical protein
MAGPGTTEPISLENLRIEAEKAEREANTLIFSEGVPKNPISLVEMVDRREKDRSTIHTILAPKRRYNACQWLWATIDNYTRIQAREFPYSPNLHPFRGNELLSDAGMVIELPMEYYGDIMNFMIKFAKQNGIDLSFAHESVIGDCTHVKRDVFVIIKKMKYL